MDHERFEARSRGDNQAAPATERLQLLGRARVNLRMLGLRQRAAELLLEVFGAEKHEWVAAIFGVSRALAMRWLRREDVQGGSAPLALLLALDEDSFERVVERFRRERAEARER